MLKDCNFLGDRDIFLVQRSVLLCGVAHLLLQAGVVSLEKFAFASVLRANITSELQLKIRNSSLLFCFIKYHRKSYPPNPSSSSILRISRAVNCTGLRLSLSFLFDFVIFRVIPSSSKSRSTSCFWRLAILSGFGISMAIFPSCRCGFCCV